MKTSNHLFLNSRDEFFRVDVSMIVYFEADGNYTDFVLCNGLKGMVLLNLSKMQDTLSKNLKQEDASMFARVGKRFIINLNYVYHIDLTAQCLTLSDGGTFSFELPISKEALKKLKELYLISITGARSGSEATDRTETNDQNNE